MSKAEKLNKLFAEWANDHANESDEDYYSYHRKRLVRKENFICDGIVNEKEYESESRRILIIAKECNAYSPESAKDEEKHLDCGDFWLKERVAAETCKDTFVQGLAMLYNAAKNDDYVKPNKDVSPLSGAAFMNLNKRGGFSACNWNTLKGYVNKYQNRIKEEIRILEPTEIICCGESVEDLVKQYNLAEPRITVRCAYHPSYFAVSDKDKLLFIKPGEKPQKTKDRDFLKPDEKRGCRGYILDTNNCNDIENEREMMRDSKAYAYGDARKHLGWYRKGDYVLFYSSGKKGITAVGTVTSPGECDKTDTSWWEVKPIVPSTFEKCIKSPEVLPMNAVNEIVYGNDTQKINMRGTVKRKIITPEQTDRIISKLKEMYKE